MCSTCLVNNDQNFMAVFKRISPQVPPIRKKSKEKKLN